MEQYIVTFSDKTCLNMVWGVFPNYMQARRSFHWKPVKGIRIMDAHLTKKWPNPGKKAAFFGKVNKNGFCTCPIVEFEKKDGCYTITYNKIAI